ncbi:Membrane protein involved in the export of O-antigen and teichoic acid [Halorubrum aquaticum]|uniref:Membrane protein involved in the export of O-antigen and teichoic acid n=1 Tax=Halorubrum aquaticum TaxID=387340 RepID=A0A1I3BF21_9EURY|nr:lipopolysaccharide biosynthesis protein [Halorubrum aquaticum]SFH60907.1 Membrane protein involved in the export of O-antigen and teichoic acid [Halorubrum aquaticum]
MGTDTTPEGADEIPDDERDALVTIAAGAVVTSGAFSAQRGLMAATEFVLARGLGPVTYGVYALAWRIAQVLVRLVPFGSVPALQRFVPGADDPARRSRVVGLAYATTAVAGVAFALGIWVAAPRMNDLTVADPTFPPTMRLFGVLVGLIGLVTVTGAVFRAIGSARGEVLFNKLLRPAVRLVGAAGALALGYSVVGVAGAIVACTALLVAVGVPVSVRATGITPTLRGARREARRFYDHAAPVAMSSFGKVFQNRIDVLLVGALLTAVAAGVYNVVLVLVSIAWIPLLSFNQLLPPVASELYAADRMGTLNAVYASVTRLIVTTVIPVIATLGVYGEPLLALFGETYVRGYLPLVVYLGGVFVGSAVGATGWLLMMTDHQYARMALDWLLAALNVGLTYAFVLRYGLVGAALGTSAAIAVQNGAQVLLLRRFEGLWPFDRTFLVPLSAGAVMVGVMSTVRAAVGGTPGAAVGTVVGVAAYLLTLRAIGVDPRDRLVVSELAGRYRAAINDR